MATYKEIVAKAVVIVDELYKISSSYWNVVDNVNGSLKKYGTTTGEILGTAGPDEETCRKLILQIIVDLRHSEYVDYRFDERENSRNCSIALHDITRMVEKDTDEFNDPECGFINISRLDHQDYEEEVETLGLKK